MVCYLHLQLKTMLTNKKRIHTSFPPVKVPYILNSLILVETRMRTPRNTENAFIKKQSNTLGYQECPSRFLGLSLL